MKYRTIVADPPWPYKSPGELGRQRKLNGEWAESVSSVKKYGEMSIQVLKDLRVPAATNAHLYLWTTNTFHAEAREIAVAWGFRPITLCTWGKVQENGQPSMKTGYYFRSATEHVIFAVRGSQPLTLSGRAFPTLWLWPRLPHSVKPGAFYDLVEQVSPGPYLELFARRQRLGWDTWGNEALQHVDLSATPRAEAS